MARLVNTGRIIHQTCRCAHCDCDGKLIHRRGLTQLTPPRASLHSCSAHFYHCAVGRDQTFRAASTTLTAVAPCLLRGTSKPPFHSSPCSSEQRSNSSLCSLISVVPVAIRLADHLQTIVAANSILSLHSPKHRADAYSRDSVTLCRALGLELLCGPLHNNVVINGHGGISFHVH